MFCSKLGTIINPITTLEYNTSILLKPKPEYRNPYYPLSRRQIQSRYIMIVKKLFRHLTEEHIQFEIRVIPSYFI